MYSITPLDGRYKKDTSCLSQYFSEYALIQARHRFELDYLYFMVRILHNTSIELDNTFTESSAKRIKEIEKTTNHDVKAVEYFIRENLSEPNKKYKELVHFGLTSHDINDLSNKHNLKCALNDILIPKISWIKNKLNKFYTDYKDLPMLSKTHGQPASPTTLGKEMKVFSYRLEKQLKDLIKYKLSVKFGGAVGNLNAHYIACPNYDWKTLMNKFIENYGMEREQYTTQLNNYDNLSSLLSIIQRINTIMVDLCVDLWLYISMDYFKLKTVKGEVGSSTMPHKVNPIFFENAEGNLKLANTLIHHLEEQLPVSRLQRDLTNSTVIRNLGTIFGYTLKSLNSIDKGLDRLDVNHNKIKEDLDNNWVIITEGIQTVLRLHGYDEAYDKLKEFSRGNSVTKESVQLFISNLDVPDTIKERLYAITPSTYIGIN